MSHGVQGDGVQTVAVFRSQIELSDGGLETDGCFSNAVFLRGCWKMGSAGLRVYAWSIRIISSGRRTNTRFPPSLLNDIEAAGIAVHILPAQFENFRGTKAGSQGEQGHIVQLRMPLFKVAQKRPDFLSGQETQPFIVSLYHLPSAALGGQRLTPLHMPVATARFMAERIKLKMLLTVCPVSIFRVGALALGFWWPFGLCIPSRRFQKLRLEAGKQIRSQIGNRQSVGFGLGVGAILAVVLVNVLPFASAPGKVGVHYLPDGNFVALNGIDAGGIKLGKELCPLLSDRGRADALAVPANGFPVALTFMISVPEAVDFVVLSGSRIALGGLAEEDALELGLCVFSSEGQDGPEIPVSRAPSIFHME
ncbi:MAG: hypothetical protein ACLR7Z_09670 [Bilophila wadsworthia]